LWTQSELNGAAEMQRKKIIAWTAKLSVALSSVHIQTAAVGQVSKLFGNVPRALLPCQRSTGCRHTVFVGYGFRCLHLFIFLHVWQSVSQAGFTEGRVIWTQQQHRLILQNGGFFRRVGARVCDNFGICRELYKFGDDSADYIVEDTFAHSNTVSSASSLHVLLNHT